MTRFWPPLFPFLLDFADANNLDEFSWGGGIFRGEEG